MKSSFIKKFFLLPLIISISACANQQTKVKINPKETSRIQVQIAIENIKDGDLHSAKTALDDAIDKNSRNAKAYMFMGIVYQLDGNAGNMQKADYYFKKAVSIEPDNSQIRNNYGQYLYVVKKYSEAITQFSEAANNLNYAERENSYTNLGLSYLYLTAPPTEENLNNAESSFISALRINPKYSEAILGLVEISLLRKQYTKASNLYSEYEQTLPMEKFSAKGLWLGIRLSNIDRNYVKRSKLGDLLETKYPNSKEYETYERFK